MPTSGPYSGNDGAVYIGANAVAQVTDFNYTVAIATRSQTKLGDSFDQNAAGLKNVSGQVTAWLDRGDDNGQNMLQEGAAVSLKLIHNGQASGDPNVTIEALITERAVTNGDGNTTTGITFSFVGGTGSAIVVEGEGP